MKIINKIFQYKYIIILLCLTIISHLEWFNISSILFNYDWKLRNNEILEWILQWGRDTWIWFYDFWGQNIQMNGWLHTIFWWVIWDYSIATKLSLFIPIAILSVLSPYLLIYYLTKNHVSSFLGSLIYWFNTYILTRQLDHLPIAIVYSLFPLIFLFFHKVLSDKKTNIVNIIIFSLLYTLSIVYEIRITFIISLILFLYFLFNISKINIYKCLLSWLIILWLNFFWILPILFSQSWEISNLTSRPLWWNHLFTLLNSISLYDWHWNWWFIEFAFFRKDAPVYYFWLTLITLIWIITLVSEKKWKQLKDILFFILLLIIWILLTKQSSPPFPNFYRFLYENIPWFNLFREASKFYIITCFSFSIIIWLFISKIKKIHYVIIIWIYILILSFINISPFVTKVAWDMLNNQPYPDKYLELNELIKKSEKWDKTLWIPFYSHYWYTDIDRPKISLWHILYKAYAWTPYFEEFTDYEIGLKTFKNPILYADIVQNNNLLDVAWINYIIIPAPFKSNDKGILANNVFPYAWDKKAYVKTFDSIKWIKRIKNKELKDIVVYSNSWSLWLVYYGTEKINIQKEEQKFKRLKYYRNSRNSITVKIENLKEDSYLYFTQAYNPGWELYIWKEKVSSSFRIYDFLNSYKLEIEKLRKNNLVTVNSDESLDVDFTLYFKPQSYFYKWLFISIITFIILVTISFVKIILVRKTNKTI